MLHSDAIAGGVFAGTKETTSYHSVYFALSKVQHARITVARNRRGGERIDDAGRVSTYAGHVIFFYRTAHRS